MDEKQICRNIKALRLQYQLTLEEMARRTGLTKGYLSKVERSDKAPPYATLSKISSALGIAVTDLFSQLPAPPKHLPLFISRAAQRPIHRNMDHADGYDFELLAQGKPGKNMEPFIFYAPFNVPRLYSHEGEEMIHVMEGRMELVHKNKTHVMETGDTAYFDSIHPHAGRSLGSQKAKLLVVIYFYKRNMT